ncbi:hypothetical protein H5410_023163 [Solanum commersonii]|uniref:Uncharacterized protein n=1 Tax=Solanum commersonii TaxID=4109 RepID=A0A9J5ZGS2_SOLCO|nr:hypothetical protein H5410_023163 [Solanum commersonii]
MLLTLNVKTHGYNYALGSQLICLSSKSKFDGKIVWQLFDEKVFLYSRHSFASDKDRYSTYFSIEPCYGPNRNRKPLLYTLYQLLYPRKTKIKINPRLNAVQTDDKSIRYFDKDIPSRSEMDFNLNDT